MSNLFHVVKDVTLLRKVFLLKYCKNENIVCLQNKLLSKYLPTNPTI